MSKYYSSKRNKIIQIKKKPQTNRFAFIIDSCNTSIHKCGFPHPTLSPLIFSFQRQFFTRYHYKYSQWILLPWSSFEYIWNFHFILLRLHYLVFEALLLCVCVWGGGILVMNNPSLIYSDSFLGGHWKLKAARAQCTKHNVKKSARFHTSLHSTFHWLLKLQSIRTWARQTACRIWWYLINRHFTTYRC